MREGLNLMQLSIDPMVVRFFAQDLTAHTLSSPAPFLCCLDTNPWSRSSRLIRRQLLLLLSFGAFFSDLEEFSIIKGFDLCLLSSVNSITLSLAVCIKTLSLLRFTPNPQRILHLLCFLQNLCAHKVLSILIFPCSFNLQGNASFFLSPSYGEFRCPPGTLSAQATYC
jgi:hypothetical protein